MKGIKWKVLVLVYLFEQQYELLSPLLSNVLKQTKLVNLKDIQLSQKLRLGLGMMKMCISEIAHLNNIRFMIYWGNAILNLNYCSSQWCTLRCRTFLHMFNAFELLSKTINIFIYIHMHLLNRLLNRTTNIDFYLKPQIINLITIRFRKCLHS